MTFLLFDAFGTLVELDDFYGRLQRGFANLAPTNRVLETTIPASANADSAPELAAISASENSDFATCDAANRVLDSLESDFANDEFAANNFVQNASQNLPVSIPLDAIRRAAHREMRHYISHSLRAHQQDLWEELRHDCAQILADALREQDATWDFSHETAYRVLDSAIVFRVFPEARAVLENLKARGVPMGVLSNWDFQLSAVLRSLDLDGFFEFVLSSAQAGFEKPDARFFNFGLEKIRELHPNLAPDECFYIGDHFEKDVIPSRAANLRALWIVREERDIASGETPLEASNDDKITRLSSLQEIENILEMPRDATQISSKKSRG